MSLTMTCSGLAPSIVSSMSFEEMLPSWTSTCWNAWRSTATAFDSNAVP